MRQLALLSNFSFFLLRKILRSKGAIHCIWNFYSWNISWWLSVSAGAGMFEIKYSFEAAVYYLKCSAGFLENFNDRTNVSNVKKRKIFLKKCL